MFAICINSVAQDSLFIFLSKIKWNCKESDLLKDYSKIIKPREHPIVTGKRPIVTGKQIGRAHV